MKFIKKTFRLFNIGLVLAKNGLDEILLSLPIFAPFRLVSYFNPWNWRRNRLLTRGERIRQSFEALGPLFIKFGQALSTRPDILPVDIAVELAKLQDKVPAFNSQLAIQTIEQAFNQPIDQLFEAFNPLPLASASMAQVHQAQLWTGEQVVVKVLRPDIDPLIRQDLSILHTLAYLAKKYWRASQRFKPEQLVQEFEYSLLQELDLRKEAANAAQLRRNFLNSPLLYIPQVFWDYSKQNVLVMEEIHGIPVTDKQGLIQHRINTKKLAETGVEIFFTQVFRDCFFHADMHPGNIFVAYEPLENPQFICVDFGIIGSLNDRDKRYIAENLYAFFNRDYRRVAELHLESGWVPANVRLEQFESAIRAVSEPIFNKPLKDISFGVMVMNLIQVAREFQIKIQPQLILLQKTLLAIEGLGRQLYPELDLWTTAKPFLAQWLKEQVGPRAFLKRLATNLPFLTEELPQLPKLIYEVLLLQKQNYALKLSKNINDLPNKRSWYYGLFTGIVLTFLSFLSAKYLLYLF